MGYSRTTKNLGLPQWNADEHPDFLTDVNEAFEKIDSNAGSTDETLKGLPERVDALGTIVTSQQEDIGQLQSDVSANSIKIANQNTKLIEQGDKLVLLEGKVGDLENTNQHLYVSEVIEKEGFNITLSVIGNYLVRASIPINTDVQVLANKLIALEPTKLELNKFEEGAGGGIVPLINTDGDIIGFISLQITKGSINFRFQDMIANDNRILKTASLATNFIYKWKENT